MINYPSNLHVTAFSGFRKSTGMIDEARETGKTKKEKYVLGLHIITDYLSTNIRESDSLSSFKKCLKTHLVSLFALYSNSRTLFFVVTLRCMLLWAAILI